MADQIPFPGTNTTIPDDPYSVDNSEVPEFQLNFQPTSPTHDFVKFMMQIRQFYETKYYRYKPLRWLALRDLRTLRVRLRRPSAVLSAL